MKSGLTKANFSGEFQNRFCGPTALSCITGKTTDYFVSMIIKYRRTYRHNSGTLDPRRFTYATVDELRLCLMEEGLSPKHWVTESQTKVAYHPNHVERYNLHPTLARFCREVGDGIHLVRVGGQQMGHFLVVFKNGKEVRVCDAAATRGEVIKHHEKFRYNRHRVDSVLTIQG